MEISPEAAQQSLAQVEDTMERTRKMMAYRGADVILIIWGVIWFLGYLSSFTSYS